MSARERFHSDTQPATPMSAGSHSTRPVAPQAVMAPMGIPVRRGRLHLGRLRSLLDPAEPVAGATWFAVGTWLGSIESAAPNLGPLAYRSETSVDGRGRVVLDSRVRSWLAVVEPVEFEVVIAPADKGGIWVVPIEDFARRWEAISR